MRRHYVESSERNLEKLVDYKVSIALKPNTQIELSVGLLAGSKMTCRLGVSEKFFDSWNGYEVSSRDSLASPDPKVSADGFAQPAPVLIERRMQSPRIRREIATGFLSY